MSDQNASLRSQFQRSAASVAFFSSVSYGVDYSFQLVDIYWVARLGAGAPTAIAVVSSIFYLILSLNEIVGASTVSVFSQTYGQGNTERTGVVIGQALLLKCCLAVLMCAAFWLFLRTGTGLYSTDDVTLAYLNSYGSVIWLSLLVVPLYSTSMTALRVIGKEASTAWISAMALALNVILNPILIFGAFGIEGGGIAGAAWATVVAQATAWAAASIALLKNKRGIQFKVASFRFEGKLYADYLLIGLPLAGVMILFSLEQAVLTNVLTRYPISVSDGFGIASRIFGLLFMLNFGLGLGASVGVGRYIGQNKIDIVKREIPRFVRRSALVMALFSLPIALVPKLVMRLFTSTTEVVDAGAAYLSFAAFVAVLFAVIYALSGVFEGAGRNTPVLLVSAVMYLVIEIPLIIIVAQFFTSSPNFLWACMLVASAFGAAGMIYVYKKSYWLDTQMRV